MSLSVLLVSVVAANPALDAYDGAVLEFTGPNCLYCQQMEPIVSQLQRAGYPIRKVDVRSERPLFEQMNVTGMPTFVLVVNGREVARRTGAMTAAELQRMCAQIPRRAADEDQRAAAGASQSEAPGGAAPGSNAADDSRGLFEFPFPGRGTEDAVSADTGARNRAAPAVENPQSPTGSPTDWDRPIIRAQNDRTPRAQPISGDPRLASSARLRVRDNGGTVYASATLIDSRPGRSLLLTCGHVFRDLPETAEIVVDLFIDGQLEQFRGEVVDFDLESDVGLLAIAGSDSFSVSPVSAGKTAPRPGTELYSIGCGGGDPPSRHEIRVTGFQRNTAPTYIECTGAPEQGRSGGGLFNEAGEVIGVCFAADAPRDRGLYASLPSIWRLLDRSGLSHLYRPSGPAPSRSAEAVAGDALVENQAPPSGAGDEVPHESVADGDAPPFAGTDHAAPSEPVMDDQQLAVAREALANPEDNEVICIIRPRNRPAAASRIVVIHRASPKFVSFLTGELERPRETARRVGFENTDGVLGVGAAFSAIPAAATADRTGAEDVFFAALAGDSEPFSHFHSDTSGSFAGTAVAAAPGAQPGHSTQQVIAQRYRRSAESRLGWPAR